MGLKKEKAKGAFSTKYGFLGSHYDVIKVGNNLVIPRYVPLFGSKKVSIFRMLTSLVGIVKVQEYPHSLPEEAIIGPIRVPNDSVVGGINEYYIYAHSPEDSTFWQNFASKREATIEHLTRTREVAEIDKTLAELNAEEYKRGIDKEKQYLREQLIKKEED